MARPASSRITRLPLSLICSERMSPSSRTSPVERGLPHSISTFCRLVEVTLAALTAARLSIGDYDATTSARRSSHFSLLSLISCQHFSTSTRALAVASNTTIQFQRFPGGKPAAAPLWLNQQSLWASMGDLKSFDGLSRSFIATSARNIRQ